MYYQKCIHWIMYYLRELEKVLPFTEDWIMYYRPWLDYDLISPPLT
jgi:hypothetical protein